MQMRKVLLLLGVVLLSMQLLAQQRTVTGKVTDEKGNPIPGASIIIKGSRTGTSSTADGSFSISVPAGAKALLVSAIGLGEQEVTLDNQSNVPVVLTPRGNTLTEVVVTSLGIARDKRSLGYATQTIKADQLIDKGQVNLVSALQGKVAGVNITGASGGAGSSVNINIRGITSFQGSNQPLFVVDGIPISNDVDRTNGGPLGTLGDNQPPNRALDLDLNNIESVNVMKGPAASVLYGSRGAGGAIIITTKKGGNARGRAEVVFSSSYSVQNVTGLPELQNEYGAGLGGVYNPASTSSWGPKFGSTPSVANGLLVGGNPVDYRAYPNNINDFFETGVISDNSISVNGGDQKQNFVLSAGYLYQTGILPNTGVKRTNVKFGGNTVLANKLKLGGSITFTNTLQNGILGGNGASSLGVLYGISRSLDLTSYKTNRTYKNIDGSNNFPIATENPYFGAYENPLTSNLYRFLGSVTVGYDINSWLAVSYRAGVDAYTDRRKQIFAVTSGRVPAGQVLENTIFRSEVNGDLMLTAHKTDFLMKDLSVNGILGQNVNQRRFQSVQAQGDNLAIPGYYNANNATNFNVGSGETNTLQRLVGYYAQMSLAYRNYLFLELTGRVDQSSTLPKNNDTYFYPSVSAGFVFTDALQVNSSVLSYGKIRANIAKVGRDAPAYRLEKTYVVGAYGNNVAGVNFPFTLPGNNVAGFGVSSRIPPDILSPEFTTSYEAGLNLGLFKNRVSIDFAVFNQISKAQIIDVGIAPSSGYSSKTTNIGEMTNKGIELLLNITAISVRDFKWDISTNYSMVRNKVVSIATGIDNFAITGSAFTGSIPSIKVGYPYGVIIGGTIPRSPDNQRIINPASGVYQPVLAGQILADPNPEYTIGVTNNFRYKGLSLNFTFDFTKGGQILSFTAASYKGRGALKESAENREQPRILPGVIQVGDKFVPNNIQISTQTYWQTVGGLQSEFNVYDATVFRMRDISIGYDIPASALRGIKLSGIRFSVFANNVFFVAPNYLLDPAVNTQGAGNIRGFDLQGAPNARTLGANVRVTL
jgi:TonB-linked SusC/RagA family outer membrane protein